MQRFSKFFFIILNSVSLILIELLNPYSAIIEINKNFDMINELRPRLDKIFLLN